VPTLRPSSGIARPAFSSRHLKAGGNEAVHKRELCLHGCRTRLDTALDADRRHDIQMGITVWSLGTQCGTRSLAVSW